MSVPSSSSPGERGPFKKLSQVVGTIASAAVVIMVTMVVLEVFLRSTIGFSFGFVDELVAYLVIFTTFFGVCITFRNQALFKVELFYGKLPRKVQVIFDLIHSVLSLILCGVLVYYAFFLISSSYSRGTVSPTKLETPLYIPQMIIPAGLIILAVFIVEFACSRLFAKNNSVTKAVEK